MKNITLAIDDELLAKVRRTAARQDTTVNALVRDYLTRLAQQDDRAAKARQGLLELSRQSTWEVPAGWKWSREDAYDRTNLRGHERADLRGVQPHQRKSKKGGSG